MCCETFSSWGTFCCMGNCNQSTHFSLLIPYPFSGVSKMVKKHEELWRALGTHVVIPLFTLQSFKMDRSWILVYTYHTQFLFFNSISIQSQSFTICQNQLRITYWTFQSFFLTSQCAPAPLSFLSWYNVWGLQSLMTPCTYRWHEMHPPVGYDGTWSAFLVSSRITSPHTDISRKLSFWKDSMELLLLFTYLLSIIDRETDQRGLERLPHTAQTARFTAGKQGMGSCHMSLPYKHEDKQHACWMNTLVWVTSLQYFLIPLFST